MRRSFFVCFGMIAAVALSAHLLSCASVKVYKVTPENTAKLEGWRYYLPRPYVVVKEPHAIAGEELLVAGELFPDGRIQVAEPDRERLNILGVSIASISEVTLSDNVAVQVGRSPTQSAQNSGAGTQLGTQAGTPTPSAAPAAIAYASDALLAGSTVVPTQISTDEIFEVEVQVAAPGTPTPKFVQFDDPDPSPIKIALLPVGPTGIPDAARAQLFPARRITKIVLTGTPAAGKYRASLSRKDLSGGGGFALGIAFTGVIDVGNNAKIPASGTAGPILLHKEKNADLFVYGAPAPAPTPPKDTPQAKSTEVEEAGGKALLATSGDPQTSPLLEIKGNPYFDIVYLSDLDEQYAIQIRSGLGQASAQMGFENGWMVERATANIDNREIGKFIFKQIDKFTDIAATALDLITKKGLGGVGTKADAGALTTQSGKEAPKSVPVTLRVIVAWEAQPGAYPFLKNSEVTPGLINGWDATGSDGQFRKRPSAEQEHLWLACPPDTRVSYWVVKRVAVELVSAESPKPKQPDRTTCAAWADPQVTATVTNTLLTILTAKQAQCQTPPTPAGAFATVDPNDRSVTLHFEPYAAGACKTAFDALSAADGATVLAALKTRHAATYPCLNDVTALKFK